MRTWWKGLNARERLLVYLAALLFMTVGLYQFIFGPVRASRSSAETEYIQMVGDVHDTLQGIDQLQQTKTQKKSANPVSSESLELLLSRSASARGLQIVRLQPSGPGQLTVWFENALPQNLMVWIYERQQRDGVYVTKADLRQLDESKNVRGNVEFSRGAAE